MDLVAVEKNFLECKNETFEVSLKMKLLESTTKELKNRSVEANILR